MVVASGQGGLSGKTFLHCLAVVASGVVVATGTDAR